MQIHQHPAPGRRVSQPCPRPLDPEHAYATAAGMLEHGAIAWLPGRAVRGR